MCLGGLLTPPSNSRGIKNEHLPVAEHRQVALWIPPIDKPGGMEEVKIDDDPERYKKEITKRRIRKGGYKWGSLVCSSPT
jgi:hypothetical protein